MRLCFAAATFVAVVSALPAVGPQLAVLVLAAVAGNEPIHTMYGCDLVLMDSLCW